MGDTRHDRILRSVVSISIAGKVYTDGIVVGASPNQDRVFIIADEHLFNQNPKSVIEVVLPNEEKVVIHNANLFSKKCGLVGIRCSNPTQELVPLILNEQIQEHERVYTFTDRLKNKLLTPGRIVSIQDETFDHNCGADQYTCCGAPVINEAGQLVGMCTSYQGYLTALKLRPVAEMIDRICGRVHISVEDTIQQLFDE